VLAAASEAVSRKTEGTEPTRLQEIANPRAIVSAKIIYFDDKSGSDAVAKKALAELSGWGRFQIVPDIFRQAGDK
jgi:hypothetical protein